MTKKRIWLLVGSLLVLNGLTGVPSLPAIVTQTRTVYPSDYSDSGHHIAITICRGVPFVWKSCKVRIRMPSTDSDGE